MNPIQFEVCCEAGHRQVLEVDGSLGLQYARSLAGLLDGTSPFYAHPPDENSPIGKCGVCGARIKATILERP